MEIYLSLKKNYRAYQTQIQTDGEIRLAILEMNHWIRLAGYQGCVNSESRVNSHEAIMGFSSKTIPRNFGILEKPDTDILVIRECEFYQGHWQFLRKAIYIGKTGRKDRNGKIIYALYDKKIPGKGEELAERINSLKINYGIQLKKVDSSNKSQDKGAGELSSLGVIAYRRADQVEDWSSVISVEYHLNHFANAYAVLRERR